MISDRSDRSAFLLKCTVSGPLTNRRSERIFITNPLKTKDEITQSWRKFIADFGLQNKQGNMRVRVRFLVTDDDKSYVRGKLAEYNKTKMITNWAIAPYTHNANPAESEMRRVMENAVCALYSSGLPPSFLLDALQHGCTCSNMLYTGVHYEDDHARQTPYERVKGSKPNINNVARFGSKTYVFVNKADRLKGAPHAWIGWYLGVSDNMLASRVYKPITHTVYDRFHTLHDSSVVYGDFLGSMYKQRVDADRQQREYFNEAVDELLAVPESPKDPLLLALRARPWARQPDPATGSHSGAEEAQMTASSNSISSSNSSSSAGAHKHARARAAADAEAPPPKRRAAGGNAGTLRAAAEAAERLLTDGQRVGPALTRLGRGQRASSTLPQEQARERER